MFELTIPEMKESSLILGRRIGIQCISTIGQLFGSSRPTLAICPLAYPHSINDFSYKTSKLCSSIQADVDERIAVVADRLVVFTNEEIESITSVYEKYYFE